MTWALCLYATAAVILVAVSLLFVSRKRESFRRAADRKLIEDSQELAERTRRVLVGGLSPLLRDQVFIRAGAETGESGAPRIILAVEHRGPPEEMNLEETVRRVVVEFLTRPGRERHSVTVRFLSLGKEGAPDDHDRFPDRD